MDMTSFGRATSGVPTQTFSASNFIGTPVPQIGQVGVTPTIGNTVQGGAKKKHIALIVAALVVGGYVAHHYFFEK